MPTYQSAYTGAEIEAALALANSHPARTDNPHGVTLPQVGGSNKDFLINSRFASQYLLNQRGQTTYTSAGYAIDGWFLTGTATLTANNGNITVSGGSGGGSLRQIIETELEQAIYTLSFNASAVSGSANLVLHKNGGDYDTPVTKPLSVGITSGSGTPNASAQYVAIVELGANASVDLISGKLEHGSESTLPNNTSPSPAEQELNRQACMRLYEKSGVIVLPAIIYNTGNLLCSPAFFKVRKRIPPTITVYDRLGNINKVSFAPSNGVLVDNLDLASINSDVDFWNFNAGAFSQTIDSVGMLMLSYDASAEP